MSVCVCACVFMFVCIFSIFWLFVQGFLLVKILTSGDGSGTLLIQDIVTSIPRALISKTILTFLTWLSCASLKIFSVTQNKNHAKNEDEVKNYPDLKIEDGISISNEGEHKNEDNIRNEADLKNEDNLENEEELKNNGDLRNDNKLKKWNNK